MLPAQAAHPEPHEDRPERLAGADAAIRFDVPATPRAPTLARRAVLEGLALPPAAAADVALLVSEAVSNCVLHAGLGPQDQIKLMAVRTGRRVTVEVRDHGRGTQVPSATPAHRSGFGLKLVNALADAWELHDGQPTRLVFHVTV